MIRVIAVVICRPPDNETLQSLWQDSKKFSPFESIQSGGPAAAPRLARITTQDMTTTTMQVQGNWRLIRNPLRKSGRSTNPLVWFLRIWQIRRPPLDDPRITLTIPVSLGGE